MAKQKAKMPSIATGREAAEGDVAHTPSKRKIVVKRKVKQARKAKGRAGVGGDPGPSPALPKGVRKATRKKVTGAAAATDRLVAKVFEGLQGALPVVGRPRKPGRPGAPVGRLERLEIALKEVRVGGRTSLRTRKLLGSGVPKMAQKVIEEAAEAAIEAIRGDQGSFVHECVDLFYNLLALASEIGVPLAAIWTEMDRREKTLGMAEKLPKAPEV